MPRTAGRDDRPLSELTRAVFGRSMTMDEAFRLLDLDVGERLSDPGRSVAPPDDSASEARLWVGSTGYERHKINDDFVTVLRKAGVKRLVDVRELPISRRRGYAKTALAGALQRQDIEYIHLKALGNPKPYRDLYKSGKVSDGRRLYQELLLSERTDALMELAQLLREKPTALMCVEHDESICHRAVILDALRTQLSLSLEVIAIG